MKHLRSTAAVVVIAAFAAARPACADEVTLIAPGGIRAAIEKLIPEFERQSGHTVKATFGSGGGTKQQVARGEPFDVPVVQPPYAEVLASGHVVADSATPLATVAVAVAVRKGERKPDISTPTALVGFLSTHAKSPEAARALLRFLSSPDAARVYIASGMKPGR